MWKHEVNNWSLTYKMEKYDKMENLTAGQKSQTRFFCRFIF